MITRLLKQVKKNIEKKDDSSISIAKKHVRDILVKQGFIFESGILTTPDGIKFQDENSVFEVHEVFAQNDYNFFIKENKDTVVFDVGMNMAASTLYFAKIKNVKKVYAFEPFLPTADEGIKNINLNPDLAQKIDVFKFGLGSEDKIIEMPYVKEASSCMSTTQNVFLLNNDLQSFKVRDIEKLEIKSASKVFGKLIEKECINVLKIDTEGAEYEIFEDLDENGLLKSFKIVMLEYHYKSPDELEIRLKNNDFVVFYRTNPIKKGEKVGMMVAVAMKGCE